MEICEYHSELVADIAVIKCSSVNTNESIARIEKVFAKHIEEADVKGGFRDRLVTLENEVKSFKQAMWLGFTGAGIIGGLIGSGSADALAMLIKWIMRHG
jgi:hypothetical protein